MQNNTQLVPVNEIRVNHKKLRKRKLLHYQRRPTLLPGPAERWLPDGRGYRSITPGWRLCNNGVATRFNMVLLQQ